MPDKFTYRFGVYTFDPWQGSLRRDDGEIFKNIQPKILELLIVFLRTRILSTDHYLTNEYLIETVWGRRNNTTVETTVEGETVGKYVRTLKAFLEANDETPRTDDMSGDRYIETKRFRGHKFLPKVTKTPVSGTESPESVEALENYIWGRQLLNTFTTESGLLSAIKSFQKVYQSNTEYEAAAYAGEGEAHLWLSIFSWRSPLETSPILERCSAMALSIDEKSSQAHTTQAYKHLFNWKWKEAEEEFILAMELEQSYEQKFANCYQGYSLLLTARGDFDGALTHIEKAMAVERAMEKLSLISTAIKGIILFEKREYSSCRNYLRKIIDKEPDVDHVYYILGSASVFEGEFDRAVKETGQGLQFSENNFLHSLVRAYIYACTDRERNARRLLANLPASKYISPFHIALVYIHFDVDEAFEWLEKAYKMLDPWLLFLGVDPRVDKLRVDRRFAALLGRIGLGSASKGKYA